MGGGKIKNKDQLSLAEARVEAELGKNTCLAAMIVKTSKN